MRFDDLQKITHLAHSQNIHVSARSLNITVGALSKTLKRIEQQLNTSLFDRVGRNIQLNANGKKFVTYAVQLTHEYEQMCSEFTGKEKKCHLRLSGPAVLLDACLSTIMPLLTGNNLELTIDALYEGDAIKHLMNGQSHIAIVTNDILPDLSAFGLESILLGSTTGTVVAGHQHPIFEKFPDGIVNIKDLLNYAFVCPKTSPFCGIERGTGSDGWLDHKYPRNISCRSDDFSSLLSLVNHGRALAYIPNIAIDNHKQKKLTVSDFSNPYQEKFSLVYKPSAADGWLNHLIYQLKQ
jgi:DNA-binding transcriptional LysR family regulator